MSAKKTPCNRHILNRVDLGGPGSFYLNNFAGVSPLFIDTTMSGIRWIEGYFTADVSQDRFYTYVEINRPLYPNDVFKVQGYPDIEYVVKKQLKRGRNKFLYEINLPNRNKFLSLHLSPLKKGKKFKVVKNIGKHK